MIFGTELEPIKGCDCDDLETSQKYDFWDIIQLGLRWVLGHPTLSDSYIAEEVPYHMLQFVCDELSTKRRSQISSRVKTPRGYSCDCI